MNAEPFQPFGTAHLTVLFLTLVLGFAFAAFLRSSMKQAVKDRVCQGIAIGLVLAVAADPVLRWFRTHDLAPVWEHCLPFHLCDIVSLILAVALIQKKQRYAEIGYFWGIAGTTQGLLTPTLEFSWRSPDFYAFFFQHSAVPIVALSLVTVGGLSPAKGAWWRVVRWSWVYLVGVFLINKLLVALPFFQLPRGGNYGFLNHKPEIASLFDQMGPWPYYLVTLQVIAFFLFFLMDLPFQWQRKK